MCRKWDYRNEGGIESWLEYRGDCEVVVAQSGKARNSFAVDSLGIRLDDPVKRRLHATEVARAAVRRQLGLED